MRRSCGVGQGDLEECEACSGSDEEDHATTKVDYGDETFRHNMSLFHHQIYMVTKQHSSPTLRHKMYW